MSTRARPSNKKKGSASLERRSTPANAAVTIRTQEEAMAHLQKEHPEFFKDQTSRDLAAIIIIQMGEELAKHSPVERAGMLACIMSLMYQMGTAALKSIRDEKRRRMGRIMVDDFRSKNPGCF